MATAAAFAATPRFNQGLVSVANPGRDGTGTVVDILTSGASGSRVDSLNIKAITTTTAGMVRIYIYDGANARLFKEVLVSAITVSATVAGFETTVALGIVLPATHKIQASTEKAESFVVAAIGGDF